MLGTFHAKFMVVDRHIAITQSNNIQDNDNTEMMAQLEGPVVDSLWDTFLVSWHTAIGSLPCANELASSKPLPTFEDASFAALFDEQGKRIMPDRNLVSSPESGETAQSQPLKEHVAGETHWDVDIAAEVERMRQVLLPTNGESQASVVSRHLSMSICPSLPLQLLIHHRQSCKCSNIVHSARAISGSAIRTLSTTPQTRPNPYGPRLSQTSRST